MPGRLRLGLELPPLSASPLRGVDPATVTVPDVARAAEQRGVGTLWIGGAGLGDIDGGPLAGAAATVTESIGIGLVDRPVRGRHPSVLAREVTTLDRLSGGRAAVALLDDGRAPDGGARLVDAASVVHRLLTEHGVTLAGRFYEVGELTLRPRPARPGGPPVLAGWVGLPPPGGVEAVVDAGARAVVAGGGPAAVAATRRSLEHSAAVVRIVWRGELPVAPAIAEQTVRSVLDAGADGVIAVLPGRAAVGGRLVRATLDAALEVLGQIADDAAD